MLKEGQNDNINFLSRKATSAESSNVGSKHCYGVHITVTNKNTRVGT